MALLRGMDIEKETQRKETNMFFTLGIIIGFVLGWFVNDKWDWVKSKQYFGRSNMFGSIIFYWNC